MDDGSYLIDDFGWEEADESRENKVEKIGGRAMKFYGVLSVLEKSNRFFTFSALDISNFLAIFVFFIEWLKQALLMDILITRAGCYWFLIKNHLIASWTATTQVIRIFLWHQFKDHF